MVPRMMVPLTLNLRLVMRRLRVVTRFGVVGSRSMMARQFLAMLLQHRLAPRVAKHLSMAHALAPAEVFGLAYLGAAWPVCPAGLVPRRAGVLAARGGTVVRAPAS